MAYKRRSPIPVVEGGTGSTTLGGNTDGVVYFNGTALATTTVGTAGQVLTSNGAGVAPTFQAGGGGGVTTIAGDTGSATGSTVTFNGLSDAGATVKFVASSATVKLDVTDSHQSTVIGVGSSSGTNNGFSTGVGYHVLQAASSGLTSTNTAVGWQALKSITSGTDNCAYGANAMNSTTSANLCSAFGSGALSSAAGTGQVGIGGNVLSNATGDYNVGLGFSSMNFLTSGSKNIGIGANAFYSDIVPTGLDSGTNNIGIGFVDADFGVGSNYTTNESFNIIIGGLKGTVGESRVTRIGNADGNGGTKQAACYIEGIASVSASANNMVTINTTTGQLGSAALPFSFAWSVITGDQTAAVNNGYICNKGSTLALALPATSAVGDIIEVTGINNATGWQVTQASGQQIFFGASATTLGATGTLTSSATRDAIRMVCIAANTTWQVLSSIGNVTVA